MAITISEALSNQILNGSFNTAPGIDFDTGSLEIRTGGPPGADAAATGTVLAAMTLPADAVGAAANRQAAKAGTWEDPSADAAGVAGHFRIIQAGDANGATGDTDERVEGTVGATGSGADLELDNVNLALGQQVTITSFTFTMPGSTS